MVVRLSLNRLVKKFQLSIHFLVIELSPKVVVVRNGMNMHPNSARLVPIV